MKAFTSIQHNDARVFVYTLGRDILINWHTVPEGCEVQYVTKDDETWVPVSTFNEARRFLSRTSCEHIIRLAKIQFLQVKEAVQIEFNIGKRHAVYPSWTDGNLRYISSCVKNLDHVFMGKVITVCDPEYHLHEVVNIDKIVFGVNTKCKTCPIITGRAGTETVKYIADYGNFKIYAGEVDFYYAGEDTFKSIQRVVNVVNGRSIPMIDMKTLPDGTLMRMLYGAVAEKLPIVHRLSYNITLKTAQVNHNHTCYILNGRRFIHGSARQILGNVRGIRVRSIEHVDPFDVIDLDSIVWSDTDIEQVYSDNPGLRIVYDTASNRTSNDTSNDTSNNSNAHSRFMFSDVSDESDSESAGESNGNNVTVLVDTPPIPEVRPTSEVRPSPEAQERLLKLLKRNHPLFNHDSIDINDYPGTGIYMIKIGCGNQNVIAFDWSDNVASTVDTELRNLRQITSARLLSAFNCERDIAVSAVEKFAKFANSFEILTDDVDYGRIIATQCPSDSDEFVERMRRYTAV